jgi:hypothetical protein
MAASENGANFGTEAEAWAWVCYYDIRKLRCTGRADAGKAR